MSGLPGRPGGGSAAPEGFTLDEIVGRLGGVLVGDGSRRMTGIATLEGAGAQQLSFLSNPRYRSQLRSTAAGAVIVPAAARDDVPAGVGAIVADDPYVYYARAAQLFDARHRAKPAPGVHATAVVDPSAHVAASACVGAHAVVDAGARIGERCVIGPGTTVGEGASIGDDTVLAARVTVYHGCVLGARCIVHSGAVIGADGFGFAPSPEGFVKIPQTGRVVIGDDVEIGANSAIDRGALDDTVVGDGVKIDNLVQVGHNVRIGRHTVIAGCAGISGSSRIGERCMIGGGAGLVGHIELADGVVVGGMSMVTRSLDTPGFYTGAFPLMTNRDWERAAVTVRHLDDMRKRLRDLERRAGPPAGTGDGEPS